MNNSTEQPKNTKHFVSQGTTTNTQQRGSIKGAGKQTGGIRPIGAVTQNLVNQKEQELQSPKGLTASQTPPALPMKRDPQGKARVGEALALFYDGLKVYGKEPEQLDNATKLFHFVLSDYPVDKIIDAFSYYLKNSTEFPAPADIAQIIERGGKPPFDKAVYVAISKIDPCNRSSDEGSYMRDYERFMISGGY